MRRGAGGGAASPRTRESSLLVDALGEFVLFLQQESQRHRAKSRRKATPSSGAELKKEVLAWVRGLIDEEWSSLCTVVDAGLVKTVLAMGMAAKAADETKRRGCSVTNVARSVVQFQLMPRDRNRKRTAAASEPREFLRRPTGYTSDGDSMCGFQSDLFRKSCLSIMQSLHALNTSRSCDTMAICMGDASRSEWIRHFEVVSGGRFLTRQPQDQKLQQYPVWEPAPWFVEQGYFTIAELVVNQIEMAIWFHWHQHLRAPASYRIPLVGIASKRILASEWVTSTSSQRNAALVNIGSHVIAYLKQLPQTTPTTITRNAQLGTLLELMISWQCDSAASLHRHQAVSFIFSRPVIQILVAPHASAVNLLVAELMQEECARILSENLSAPENGDVEDGSESVQTRSSHAQRRRAARKKAAKLRKQDQEWRHRHQRLMASLILELRRAAKAWHQRTESSVRELVNDMLDSIVASIGSSEVGVSTTFDDGVHRAKRRKKRGKKKGKKLQAGDNELSIRTDEMDEEGKENSMAIRNSIDSSFAKVSKNVSDTELSQSMIVRPDTSRPLLSFLATSHDSSYGASRSSTAYGLHSFYTSSSPFYLQLTSHRDPPSSAMTKAELENDEVGDINVPDVPDVEQSFDWYLPSLFSSQSSVHTSSTAASLDWDFQRWSSKSNSVTAPIAANGSKVSPSSKPTAEKAPSPNSSAADEDVAADMFPLNPFSNFIDASARKSSDSTSLPGETDSSHEVTPTSLDENTRSDFLYREGGFFDRQRGSKRRRRPFPFEYDDEDEEQALQSTDNGDRLWENRLSSSSENAKSVGRNSSSTTNSNSCTCKSSGSVVASAEERGTRDGRGQIEQISRLEALLEDRLSKIEEDSAAKLTEISNLKQQISVLTGRVQSLESEVEELRGNHIQDPKAVPPSTISVKPNPRVDTEGKAQHIPDGAYSSMTVPSAQGYPHPIMRPGGAPTYSVLGPFVSVPMSVLPPRSKLHWDMCEYVSQLQADSNARLSAQMAAIRFCTSAVQSLWPRAQVRPYGSFVTRLALPSSDVDLVICLPKVRRDAPADAAGVLEGRNAIKESWQQNLARKLRQEPWVLPDSVKTIPHAAIPIITLATTLPLNIRLDISFEGPGHNGLATNDVVLSLMREFPPLAPVMLVLKSFVIERGFAVAYSGGLSSYALLLMIARYLQEHTDRYDISGASPTSPSSSADFGMVLMGLLDFYGNRFDPRTTGISVATRCFFNRDSISPSHHHGPLPNSMLHTVDDTQDHWQQMNQGSQMHNGNLLSSPGSRRHSNRTSIHEWPANRAGASADMGAPPHDPHKFDPLFIEDPLHPSNNVGRNCFRITQIRRAFAAGYATLMTASMSSSVFSANRNNMVGGVALHPDNILRAILGANAPASNGTGVTKIDHEGGETPHATAPPVYHAPKPRGNHRAVPNPAHPMPTSLPYYGQQQPPAPYGPGIAFYNGAIDNQAFHPPYMFQRVHHQPSHQQHPPHQHNIPKAQSRGPDTYRRHSGSVTEHMTTRSEAASSGEMYYTKRSNKQDRNLVVSPRLMQPTMHRSSSIELDKKTISNTNGDDANGFGRGATRKCPSRSMSFADVVVSGGTAVKSEHQRKAPSSPLALVRTSSSWRRSDSAMDEALHERLETRDDFELK